LANEKIDQIFKSILEKISLRPKSLVGVRLGLAT
jgi:hypothetical protein